MDESLTPTLCLDGAAVRRIREEKKLTQLYVAKVVGVTTDTISRWENNRYPSVKRENVLRLAEALEVPLDQILQGTEEEPPPAEEAAVPPPRRAFARLAWAAGSAVIVLAAAGWWVAQKPAPVPVAPRIAAERILPSGTAPGSILPVRVRLQLEKTMKGFILREHFPPGWKIIEASPPASSLDNEEGTAGWIVKPEELQQTISYLVQIDPGAPLGQVALFQGVIVASANGHDPPVKVGGAAEVRVSPHLWADLNGDNVVDDGEMLLASEMFDEMKGVHLDWKHLETIWDAGQYQWLQEEHRFAPAKPSTPSPEKKKTGT